MLRRRAGAAGWGVVGRLRALYTRPHGRDPQPGHPPTPAGPAPVHGGAGGVSRTPVAWVFERKSGRQTRPYKTCYVQGEAEALVAQNPERFYMVVWGDIRR